MATTRKRASKQPDLVAQKKEQLTLLSEALARVQFAQRAGLQYDGDRDVYRMAGYKHDLVFGDYAGLYERDAVAGTIVDKPAQTTWRKSPEIVELTETEGEVKPLSDTAFAKAFAELAERLGLWNRLERVDRSARKGRYAVLLIGATDAGDDQGLSRPLGRVNGPEGVAYLQAYDESMAVVARWDSNPRSPRFGQPESYTISFASADVAAFRATHSAEVHHTRVIHVAEDLLNDEVYGRPALKRVFNALTDLTKVSASTGEAFWQRVAGVMQAIADNSKDQRQLTDPELARLDADLKEVYHNLRRTFIAQGVELKRLDSTEPNPTSAATLFMRLVAAGADIPMRLLFGSETGERASTEDIKSFLGTIAERQVQYAEPQILRPFITRMIACGALPSPKNKGKKAYQVVWPSLFTESDLDNAMANKARAETAKALTPVGGDPIELIEVDADRNVWLKVWKDGKPPRDVIVPPEPAPPGGGGIEPEPEPEP